MTYQTEILLTESSDFLKQIIILSHLKVGSFNIECIIILLNYFIIVGKYFLQGNELV